MIKKGILPKKASKIDEIYSFFQYLGSDEGYKKFNSLYILNYIYQYISSEEVSKRKTSARVFEDLLAILFSGEVTDSKKRKNLRNEVPDCFNLVKDKIAGNKREKVDLIFDNVYGVSVKTLMIDNKELNLGSFEKKVLFDGLNVTEYLTERKTDSELGLASIPRLKKLLEKIDEENNYQLFETRFIDMFNYIFSDDLILAIKNSTKMYLYFFTGKEFTNLVTKNTHDLASLLSIVNRWEGNSIRINRDSLIAHATKKVELDLSLLSDTVIAEVNKFDFKLHQSYVKYFNESNIEDIQITLIKELEKIFKEFESNIGELKA